MVLEMESSWRARVERVCNVVERMERFGDGNRSRKPSSPTSTCTQPHFPSSLTHATTQSRGVANQNGTSICYFCDGFHWLRDCQELQKYLECGLVIRDTKSGQVKLSDGKTIPGRGTEPWKLHVDLYWASKVQQPQSQFTNSIIPSRLDSPIHYGKEDDDESYQFWGEEHVYELLDQVASHLGVVKSCPFYGEEEELLEKLAEQLKVKWR
jgi:hypothetical protein